MKCRRVVLSLTLLAVVAGCGRSSSHASQSVPSTLPLSARQRATVCTARDISPLALNDVPLPSPRRLTHPDTAWFGRVRLEPVAPGVQPRISLEQAWNAFGVSSSVLGFSGSMYASAIYDVVLAYWTSDASLVEQVNGRPVAHDHVLAWVAVGTHRPVAAADVDSQRLTVPGVPCYFGTSITAVDAMTGQPITDALDYH